MDQLRRLIQSLSWRQRIVVILVALAVVGGILATVRWKKERDFKPLYSNLAAEDAAAVVARLKESGVEYRLAENGAAIAVPSARVAELRLQMAAAGLPKTGRVGFELFDKTNFGATDFAEQVNYHRALEGELERSIISLTEIEQARVHITFAKESVFVESRRPAKASVLVKLRAGARLAPANVAAIGYLVSSSVQGLEVEAVSILDMRGNLLSRVRPKLEDGEMPPGLIDFRQTLEKDLLAKIDATLEPLLGAEKYRARVYVDCDPTSGEQSEEVFDPARSVMSSQQRSEDVTSANSASGVPGTASALPRPTSRPGSLAAGLTRRTENITYQASRTVRRTRLPRGAVKRVSAAVLLDHAVRWEGSGPQARRILEAPSPERLKAIRDLVSAAIGLSPTRGDLLTLEALPFESTLSWRPPESPAPSAPTPPSAPFAIPLPPWLQKYATPVVMAAAAGGLLLALLLAVAFLVLRGRRKKGRAQAEVAAPAALPPTAAEVAEQADAEARKQMEAKIAEQSAIKEKLYAEAVNSLKLPQVQTKKTEVLSKHLSDEAKKDPSAMAQLLRTWLGENE